jgi:hypothetical protein
VVARGEPTTIRLRAITSLGVPDYDFEGAFRIEAWSPTTQFPPKTVLEPAKEGYFEMHGIVFPDAGVQGLRGLVPGDTIRANANPIVVMENPEYRIFWGDLDGQSDLSSGAQAPGVYFSYASTIALLDFAALTDNDRVESLGKSLDAKAFRSILDVADGFDAPGRFVALQGFEWTSPIYGNRLVYFGARPDSLPSSLSGVDTPAKLRAALPAGSLVAVAHPSGSVQASPTDPGSSECELIEIYSALGCFEQPGTHRASSRETPGAAVRDLLKKGIRPGFIACSDTPLSTPGNPQPITTGEHRWPGGLTAILAKELTREGLLAALRARRCYATTGPRFLLEFTVDGKPMGSELRVPSGHEAEVYGSLGAVSKWMRVEIVGPEGPLAVLTPQGEEADVVELTAKTKPVTEPTWVYLRGFDEFGAMAWSSPVYLSPL